MNQNKKIFKNTIFLYIKLIVTSIIGLLTSRLVLDALGASDYGLYNVVGGIVVLLNILNTAMISTTYRFVAFEIGKKNGNPNKVFNISLILHVLFSFIIILFACTIGQYYLNNYLNVEMGKLPDAFFVFKYSIITAIISILSIPFRGLLAAMENFKIDAIIEICSSLLKLLLILILLDYSGNSLRLYAVFSLLIVLFTAFCQIIYGFKKYKKIVQIKIYKEWSKYKEMLKFSFWITFGATSDLFKTQGSSILVNFFFGTTLNAAYGIANQLNSFVLMFTQNLSTAAIPQITKSYSGGDSDRSVQLVSYISKYSFFLMLIPALPLLLQIDFILDLWLKNVPSYTSIFVILMVIDALISCLGAGIPALIQATGKIKYFQLTLSILSLSSLPIAYLFFKYNYPPYSILIIYCIISLFVRIFSLLLLKILINFDIINFIKISYLRVLYVVIAIIPIFIIKDYFNSVSLRIISIFLSELLLFLSIYFLGIEKSEKKNINSSYFKIKTKLCMK